jgi:aconitate hydratase
MVGNEEGFYVVIGGQGLLLALSWLLPSIMFESPFLFCYIACRTNTSGNLREENSLGGSIVRKILKDHLVSGNMEPGTEIGITIDQTLTQDATGTMAYLQLETLDLDRVTTELSVSYIDHNTLQNSFENADDHLYLQTVAARYGIHFSRPGNGICHQVHLERFGIPGKTLLGSDSHTPTAGGLGMLAIGAGGLDVAVAMAGEPFYLHMPSITRIELQGHLPPWVGAKDIILEILRRLTVKGGMGRILEYGGEGVATLSVTERATITNMGAELGATTSVFPSDETTRDFLRAQGREKDWQPLLASPEAHYDETVTIILDHLEPLAACPHSPDHVRPLHELSALKVNQVAIGSCTNSSFTDMMLVAHILRDKVVHPDVSLVIAPGSKQVLEMLARNGALTTLIRAGARIMEPACGPCIGMGQAPPSGGVSVRTFNRNFSGRSGTRDAQVYLTGPAAAAAAAIHGELIDPRQLGEFPRIEMPERFAADDSMIIPPAEDTAAIEIIRGPNIKPLPRFSPLPDEITGEILLKVGDNITTDDIMPAGSRILPLRSNIPAISAYLFHAVDPTFPERAASRGGGIILGGENYGQGSSREHAALAPRYLGIKAVLALSFARIHHTNLVNFGILPLVLPDRKAYDDIKAGDCLRIPDVMQNIDGGRLEIINETDNTRLMATHQLSPRQIDTIRAGGLLNYTRECTRK